MRLPLIVLLCLALNGCATAAVTGAVVGTTAKVGTLAVKGAAKATVGTGKLVYRGGKALAGTEPEEEPTRSVSCDELPDPKPQTCLTY